VIFTKAVEWEYLRENPAKRVKKFRLDNRRLIYLEKDEISRLLAACSRFFRPIVEVFILTGLRREELFRLKWSDIDFRLGVVHITKTKSGKPRQIPLNGRLRAIFKTLPRHIASDRVFCQSDGKPWKDLRGSLAAAVEKAGITKHVTFHTLRHTFASQSVMSGVDLYTVSELLGHSSLEMTQRYAHLSQDHKTRAMAQLESYLSEEDGSNMAVGNSDSETPPVSY